MDRVRELFERVGSKCIREFGGSGMAPKLKIYFGGVDALWISEGEAKVRGVEEGGFYKFWEASEFSEYTGPEEMLGDNSRMAEAKTVELIYGEGRKVFNSWGEFIRWLEDE
ncbi:MAG: hypothetical protein QW176_03460 [Candidatus Bathyarchaeia archaeon]